MDSEFLSDRSVLEVSGEDSRSLLQGLVTNDIGKLSPISPLYAALLTPQGKIVCDFFLYDAGSSVLLDCARGRSADLQARLGRYRLRAKVEIGHRPDRVVSAGDRGVQPDTVAWQDPRHSALGWRAVGPGIAIAYPPPVAYVERRLALGIPEGDDFGCERMFALDADLEELHGVSFDKGCYVGQELTARMKHRGTARRKLIPIIALEALLPAPETPLLAAERDIGTVAATYGNRGFALIRTDRLAEVESQPVSAGGISVNVIRPPWLFP